MTPPPGDEAGPRPAEAAPPPPGEPWTVLRMMRWSARYLEEKGVESGRLDAEHLLAHVLGMGRLDLYLQFERPLGPGELAAYKPLLLRRAAREPLQYVLGTVSFRELELRVDGRVLIPRPETEELVQAVLDWTEARSGTPGDREEPVALDVGTGSGCVALSLAAEGPFVRVVATDPSRDALELAEANARTVGVEEVVHFLQGTFFEPVAGQRFDVVVSNPPYIAEADRDTLAPEIREWEPSGALFAGPEGLDVLRRLVGGAPAHLRSGGLLALEVGAGQAAKVAEMARSGPHYHRVRVLDDLSRRPRFVLAERRAEGADRHRDDDTETHSTES